MRVERLDAANDEAAARAWFAAFEPAADDHRAVAVRLDFDDWSAFLHDPAWPHTVFWVRSGEEVVGTMACATPLYENRHLLDLAIRVPPIRRRQGVGAALLEAAESYGNEQDRTTLLAEVIESLSVEQGGSPGSRFAAAAGFSVGMVEQHHIIDLPVSAEQLQALEAYAGERANGYRLVEFGIRCPPEYVEPFCVAQSRFLREAPLGDLDLEPEVWTPQRLAETEDRRIRQGRDTYTVMAIATDGSVAGYTQLFVLPTNDGRVVQADTLVLPEHQGHRLGLAMKVRNLRLVQDDHPDRTYVGTWNAESNAAMLAVNQRLGAAPRERMLEYQRSVGHTRTTSHG